MNVQIVELADSCTIKPGDLFGVRIYNGDSDHGLKSCVLIAIPESEGIAAYRKSGCNLTPKTVYGVSLRSGSYYRFDPDVFVLRKLHPVGMSKSGELQVAPAF